MSIEKHLQNQLILQKQPIQAHSNRYRVRQLQRNQSHKQFSLIKSPQKIKQIMQRINQKQFLQTSFFMKENRNNLQFPLPQNGYKKVEQINKNKNSSLRKNSSHRVLRKINSHQLIPSSNTLSLNIVKKQQIKEQFQTIQTQGLKKKRISKKIQFNQTRELEIKKSQKIIPSIIQIRSENMIEDKKKSKQKLKILVRDPFKNTNVQKTKLQNFAQSNLNESKIQALIGQSFVSQANRQQFQQLLSCIN